MHLLESDMSIAGTPLFSVPVPLIKVSVGAETQLPLLSATE